MITQMMRRPGRVGASSPAGSGDLEVYTAASPVTQLSNGLVAVFFFGGVRRDEVRAGRGEIGSHFRQVRDRALALIEVDAETGERTAYAGGEDPTRLFGFWSYFAVRGPVAVELTVLRDEPLSDGQELTICGE